MRLTRENTAIVLDSTSDFPEARERLGNARVVPLYVRFGDESFRDYVDLDSHSFYERLKAAPELPTTSQPTPGDFLAVYEELAGQYERIWSLHLSAKLSGTYASAEAAAEQLGGDRVRLVDTKSASTAIAMLALAFERRLDRGTSDEELEELVARFHRESGVVFTVATLEFLAKGGRIGRGRALAGQLLNVKPILSVEDGEVVPVTRVRGRGKALEELARRLEAATADEPGLRIGIAHADAEEWVDDLRSLVTRVRPQAEVELVARLGAVVGTHAGPGAVGFFLFADPE